jgi:hypothetical protein
MLAAWAGKDLGLGRLSLNGDALGEQGEPIVRPLRAPRACRVPAATGSTVRIAARTWPQFAGGLAAAGTHDAVQGA